MFRKIKAFDGNKNHGFTLIEMLIVIAVIAILAGVVLTGVSGFQASARDTRRIGDLRNAQNHLELFFNRCGHYPVDSSICGGVSSSVGTVGWSELTTALETVTSQVPKDPGATVYKYGFNDNGLNYVLKATLERENRVLQEDINSSGISGLDCADTTGADGNFYYCIKS